MKTIFTFFRVFILLCLLANCKTADNALANQTVIRQAENTPEYFSSEPNMVLDNESCKSPMLDSRNGTKIVLISSRNGLGKYKVTEGTYGVKKGEALLLDCSSGAFKGIVKL